MSAIAAELPADVVAVRDGLLRFVEAEVAPRLARNHAMLEDARKLFGADGSYSPEARALIGEVRMASAAAGFYSMCAPVALGGGRAAVPDYFLK